MPEWLTGLFDKCVDALQQLDLPDTSVARKFLFVLVVGFLTVSGILCYALLGDRGGNTMTGERLGVYITVEPGMNAGDIGELLQKRGVIGSKQKFWLIAKLGGEDRKFKAGTYHMYVNMPIREALDVLVSGEASMIRFTIPEGFTVREIASRLEREGIVSSKAFLDKAKHFGPYRYMQASRQAMFRSEGFLFPDTYEVEPGTSAEAILQMMVRNFDNKLTDEMREKAAKRNLSIYELITLASLVEKEARYEEDRPIIAQVFYKRLDINMPLQSDTTIQYLLDVPKEDVTYADTEIDSPYNTYQNYGLPPGPIANPGLASIEAVLDPADTDYLYFVADRAGHNHYTKDYEEHLENVNRVR
ncbi:MAG: endolytic transglycosylase MltG [Schwartzia sp.]|nr:endolytic transglycosylase MltG [Schwartzia sp. (in: firmicutes)]